MTHDPRLQQHREQQTLDFVIKTSGQTRQQVEATLAWGKANLSHEELMDFNDRVSSGESQARQAFGSLLQRQLTSQGQAQMNQARENDAQRLQALTPPQPEALPFQTREEVSKALTDPRYAQGGYGSSTPTNMSYSEQYTNETNRRIEVTPDELF